MPFLIILCQTLSKCHLQCAARSSLFQWANRANWSTQRWQFSMDLWVHNISHASLKSFTMFHIAMEKSCAQNTYMTIVAPLKNGSITFHWPFQAPNMWQKVTKNKNFSAQSSSKLNDNRSWKKGSFIRFIEMVFDLVTKSEIPYIFTGRLKVKVVTLIEKEKV